MSETPRVTVYDVRAAMYQLGQRMTVDDAEELHARLESQRVLDLWLTCTAAAASARYGRQRRKQARMAADGQ